MAQTRANIPSSRVYKSLRPPRQQKLRSIMKKPQKRRRASGSMLSLRQETMTQFGYGYTYPEDDENQDIENESPKEEEQEKPKRRRKRRKTLGDSPANQDSLSRKRQSTLTQIGFVERPRWVDPDLEKELEEEEANAEEENMEEEAGSEREEHVKREKSIPIWEDEAAEPRTRRRSKRLHHTRSRPNYSDEESTSEDHHISEEDEGDDNEDEIKLRGSSKLQRGSQLVDDTDSHCDSSGRDITRQGEEFFKASKKAEIGDSDEDLDGEDSDNENRSNESHQTPLKLHPPPTHSSQSPQIQVASTMGPPMTPRKRRYEIPDSDAESEDISPEKITPLKLASSYSIPTQTTPSKTNSKLLSRLSDSSASRKAMQSSAPAPMPPSQATTVDLSQYTRSQSVSAQKTPTRKLSREPTKTSPFVLRSSQLLTESQMLPASLMDSAPMPPRWFDSDEENEVDDLDEDDEL